MPSELDLRDIHLPDPISWWPPAPGWWLLLFAMLLLFGVVFCLLKHRHKKHHAPSALALLELTQIQNEFAAHKESKQLITSLSALLRRLAVSRYPRRDCAALTGEKWLRFLDDTNPNEMFSEGVGRLLIEAPYRPIELDQAQSDALIILSRNWIEAQG